VSGTWPRPPRHVSRAWRTGRARRWTGERASRRPAAAPA